MTTNYDPFVDAVQAFPARVAYLDRVLNKLEKVCIHCRHFGVRSRSPGVADAKKKG